MNVLIVEDEEIAANHLENHLHRIDPEIRVMAKTESVKETVRWLGLNHPDLIFMDIHLSDGLSFKIFEQLELKTPVIFTTAYDQYTLKAFHVFSIDYLLKPIQIDELAGSLEKYKKLTGMGRNQTIDIKSLIETLTQQKEYQKRFVVYAGQKIKMIKTEDIAYFYGSDKGTFLFNFSNTWYSLEYSLDRIEGMLDPELFFRINRNFIVNLEAIREMYTLSKSRIKLELNPKPEMETLVSFNRMSSFRKWINK